jgi:hypothetical protein
VPKRVPNQEDYPEKTQNHTRARHSGSGIAKFNIKRHIISSQRGCFKTIRRTLGIILAGKPFAYKILYNVQSTPQVRCGRFQDLDRAPMKLCKMLQGMGNVGWELSKILWLAFLGVNEVTITVKVLEITSLAISISSVLQPIRSFMIATPLPSLAAASWTTLSVTFVLASGKFKNPEHQ